MASQTPEQCALLSLPPEVRNRISEAVSIVHEDNHEPNYFRTCRQIREEGLKLFYATHTFFFTGQAHSSQRWAGTSCQHFITCIGPRKAALLEHFRFSVSDLFSRDEALADIRVTVDPEKLRILDVSFAREDIADADVAALTASKDSLNSVWSKLPSTNRVGFLRTLTALVPRKVSIKGASVDEQMEILSL